MRKNYFAGTDCASRPSQRSCAKPYRALIERRSQWAAPKKSSPFRILGCRDIRQLRTARLDREPACELPERHQIAQDCPGVHRPPAPLPRSRPGPPVCRTPEPAGSVYYHLLFLFGINIIIYTLIILILFSSPENGAPRAGSQVSAIQVRSWSVRKSARVGTYIKGKPRPCPTHQGC